MITVTATREGLVNKTTAAGWHIDRIVPFVALPTPAALRLWVRLFNPANGKTCRALVLDVGPWNIADTAYVFQSLTLDRIGIVPAVDGHVAPLGDGIRPQAETGVDAFGRVTNKAGIDLGEAVWAALGLPTNGGSASISWEFL